MSRYAATQCPECKRISHNIWDIRFGWCDNCKIFYKEPFNQWDPAYRVVLPTIWELVEAEHQREKRHNARPRQFPQDLLGARGVGV